MSDKGLAFSAGPLSIVVNSSTLEVFDLHRQRRLYHREAGGQLFARVRGTDWEIVHASGPKARDRRSRFSFWPHRASEQQEIFEQHARGFDYVGDWHTHPEDFPTPSENDLSSISTLVRESKHHLPGFLLLIVGRRPFPKGLWASFHPLDGTAHEAKNWREIAQELR